MPELKWPSMPLMPLSTSLRDGGTGLRVSLVVFRHQLELHFLAGDLRLGGVELFNSQGQAVLHVLAVLRLRAGHRAQSPA